MTFWENTPASYANFNNCNQQAAYFPCRQTFPAGDPSSWYGDNLYVQIADWQSMPGYHNQNVEMLGYSGADDESKSCCAYTSNTGSAVSRRNERERNRVKHINRTFSVLRQHLPGSSVSSKRLSKVDTLKATIKYINHLQHILNDEVPMTTVSSKRKNNADSDNTDSNKRSRRCDDSQVSSPSSSYASSIHACELSRDAPSSSSSYSDEDEPHDFMGIAV